MFRPNADKHKGPIRFFCRKIEWVRVKVGARGVMRAPFGRVEYMEARH